MNPVVSVGNKFRWKFENVSKLTEDGLDSDTFQIDGVDWQLNINAIQHSFANKCMYINLCYASDNQNNRNWICECHANVKLLNQCGTNKHIDQKMKSFYEYQILECGHSGIEWGMLMEEENGYIKKDSVVIEVDFSFRYYDYSKNIENFTDIIIRVKDDVFYVNKGVLCSKSEYFYHLFVNRNSDDERIELENITAINFCYLLASFDPYFNGVDDYNYQEFIIAAKLYGVSSLHCVCEKYLLNNAPEIGLFDKIKYADEHGYESLMKQCIELLATSDDIKNLHANADFFQLKEATKLKIMMRLLEFC